MRAQTVLMAVCVFTGAVLGGPGAPDYDFEWVTIDQPGNAPYQGEDPMGWIAGHGHVNEVYRIAKLEITTNQWLEFVNAMGVHVSSYGDQFDFGHGLTWGAHMDPYYDGPGIQYKLSGDINNAAHMPIKGMEWRDAAKYANWLHNNKGSDPASVEYGAYDASTFGDIPGGGYTDDMTPLPGAKFRIPTMDEWMKSAFYDPDRYGPGEGGWWTHPNGKDTLPVPGWPGEEGAETSAGLEDWFEAQQIPIGSYPDQQSPWGLLDTSGAGAELTQGVPKDHPIIAGGPVLMGSPSALNEEFMPFVEPVYHTYGNPGPGTGVGSTLRIVSIVPPSEPAAAADLDGSGGVNSTDLNIVLSAFGCVGGECDGDVDADGDTDWYDLNAVLDYFGETIE